MWLEAEVLPGHCLSVCGGVGRRDCRRAVNSGSKVDSGTSTVPAIKQQSLPTFFHFLSCQILWSDENDENWREKPMKKIHYILYFLENQLLVQTP